MTSLLGKKTTYSDIYNPQLLYPIARASNRQQLAIGNQLPFKGSDIWNAYELSWLNVKGKPVVATAKLVLPCESPYLIESKSLKLYLNSFNNTHFSGVAAVESCLTEDLSKAAGAPVAVEIVELQYAEVTVKNQFEGFCLDTLDVTCDHYQVTPSYLTTFDKRVVETVYTNLLKSNCLVTHQPDWGSLQIVYQGKQINHAGLLQYIVSFRQHAEFHEHCVERIFMDIMQHCQPDELTVYARYVRRGGLDINPWRATKNAEPAIDNARLLRQ